MFWIFSQSLNNINMFGLYILIFGIFLALLEIEIEGEHGWAKNLPTWRKTKNNAPLGFLRNITGYHLTLNLMILALNHIFFIGLYGYTGIVDELFILWFTAFLIIYWDFLWFILNPHFTIQKFEKEHIPWYTDSRWIMWFPLDYWYGIGISVWFALLGYSMDTEDFFEEYMITFALGILVWCMVFFASPLYHKWYHFIRK